MSLQFVCNHTIWQKKMFLFSEFGWIKRKNFKRYFLLNSLCFDLRSEISHKFKDNKGKMNYSLNFWYSDKYRQFSSRSSLEIVQKYISSLKLFRWPICSLKLVQQSIHSLELVQQSLCSLELCLVFYMQFEVSLVEYMYPRAGLVVYMQSGAYSVIYM